MPTHTYVTQAPTTNLSPHLSSSNLTLSYLILHHYTSLPYYFTTLHLISSHITSRYSTLSRITHSTSPHPTNRHLFCSSSMRSWSLDRTPCIHGSHCHVSTRLHSVHVILLHMLHFTTHATFLNTCYTSQHILRTRKIYQIWKISIMMKVIFKSINYKKCRLKRYKSQKIIVLGNINE